MWVMYLDFMRQQWPDIEDVETIEKAYCDFNSLAPPYRSAFSDWLQAKKTGGEDSGPYKRAKLNPT